MDLQSSIGAELFVPSVSSVVRQRIFTVLSGGMRYRGGGECGEIGIGARLGTG